MVVCQLRDLNGYFQKELYEGIKKFTHICEMIGVVSHPKWDLSSSDDRS